MKILILSLCLFVVLTSSCKDTPSNEEVSTQTGIGNYIHPAPTAVSAEDKVLIDNNRNHAFHLIDSRSKSEGAYSAFTDGYWMYEGIFSGGGKPKPVKEGFYLKFNEDFSYYYGFKAEVHGGGRYHITYNADEPKLILLDNNPLKVPEEFTAKTSDGFLVLVGSSYFGNNHKQMKLFHQPYSPAR